MTSARIPVNEPLLTEADYASVMEALRSGWISGAGPHVEAFESRWAAYCGRKHGIALANGTVALQVAVALLDLQPGDEVIMPTFTIISCALPVVLAGATPVLVDSEPQTWTMNVDQVEARITDRTRALMPVHMYGHPVDMDPLLDLAERYNLPIIEDAAEAHGAEYRGRRAGQLRHVELLQLLRQQADHHRRRRHAPGRRRWSGGARAPRMRNLGFQPGRRFLHAELGFNFRLTNLQAALGLTQVERMDEIVERKRRMGQAYTERLSEMAGLELQVQQPWAKSVYWMYGLVVGEETGLDAAEFGRRLAERGVETRPFFLGMHEQPVLQERGLFAGESYPVAERIARQGLYLPSGLGLEESQIDRVCQAVGEALR